VRDSEGRRERTRERQRERGVERQGKGVMEGEK